MNRKQMRKLQHNAKMAVVCMSMLYLTTGLNAIGKGTSVEKVYANNTANAETKNIYGSIGGIEKIAVETEKSCELSYRDAYLLAKIAMAEAEGEDTQGKALVMKVVLNRVEATEFPENVEEVIFQKNGSVWQFSSVCDGGRWYTTEPNDDCWEALNLIENGWDESQGALYFESIGQSEWHTNNLEFLFNHGKHYFYKEKEQVK